MYPKAAYWLKAVQTVYIDNVPTYPSSTDKIGNWRACIVRGANYWTDNDLYQSNDRCLSYPPVQWQSNKYYKLNNYHYAKARSDYSTKSGSSVTGPCKDDGCDGYAGAG